LRAREVYTKVVRSAIAYGASAYHTPADPIRQAPRGIAKPLTTIQSSCLRVVAGAYRATPIRSLETETQVPPLDLYLNKRVAEFETRLAQTGAEGLLQGARRRVATTIRSRRTRTSDRPTGTDPRPASNPDTENRAEWTRRWLGAGTAEEALERDWRARWQKQLGKAMQERPSRDIEPADYQDFSHTALAKHAGLQKHESSLLVQIRTGKIGLKAFLHSRRVPGVTSPGCECGAGRETALHLILECRDTTSQRWDLMEALGAATPTDRSSLAEATKNGNTGREIVRWLLRLGRLREFRLAIRLAQDSSEVEDVEREAAMRGGAAAGSWG